MLPKRNRKLCAIKVLQWVELIEIHVIIYVHSVFTFVQYIFMSSANQSNTRVKTGICDILLGKVSITL